MKETLQVVNITQSLKNGSVSFTLLDGKDQPVIDASKVIVQFVDPKKAAEFVYGGEYDITFTLKTK